MTAVARSISGRNWDKIKIIYNLYWWQIQNQSTRSTASDADVAVGYPEGTSCMTVMGVMVRNGCTYRANNTAVCQWIYAYSCLAGKAPLPSSFLFFPLPLGLFPWDSYQFVLILPRPVVAVWKLRCRHGKKMCVYLCVCLFVSGGGRKSSEEKGKEKVKRWRRWQVEGGSLGFFPCHRKSVWPVTKCQANEDGSGGRA